MRLIRCHLKYLLIGMCESGLKLAAVSARPRNLSLASLSAITLVSTLLMNLDLVIDHPESGSSKCPLVVTSYASDSVVSALPACWDVIGRGQGVERSHWLVRSSSKVWLQTASRNTETFLKFTIIPLNYHLAFGHFDWTFYDKAFMS